MYWHDKKGFMKTYSILKNEVELLPIFRELKTYIETEFNIQVYNFEYKKVKKTLSKRLKLLGKGYKLICNVSSKEDRDKMLNNVNVFIEGFPNAYKQVHDEIKQKKIVDKFVELSTKYNYPIRTDRNNIWVDYFWFFNGDYLSYIVDHKKKELTKLVLDEFQSTANIWRIVISAYCVYVFYYTEEDKKKNLENGQSNQIQDMCYQFIKQGDDLNLYKKDFIDFDSKENLDNNYQGSIYYYLR